MRDKVIQLKLDIKVQEDFDYRNVSALYKELSWFLSNKGIDLLSEDDYEDVTDSYRDDITL